MSGPRREEAPGSSARRGEKRKEEARAEDKRKDQARAKEKRKKEALACALARSLSLKKRRRGEEGMRVSRGRWRQTDTPRPAEYIGGKAAPRRSVLSKPGASPLAE